MIPSGMPITSASTPTVVGLPRDGRRDLPTRESEGREQREITAPTTHRADQRVRDGGRREHREHEREHERSRADAVVGDDVRRPLHALRRRTPPGRPASRSPAARTSTTRRWLRRRRIRRTSRRSRRDRSRGRARRAARESRPHLRRATSCRRPGTCRDRGAPPCPRPSATAVLPSLSRATTRSPVPTPSWRFVSRPSAISPSRRRQAAVDERRQRGAARVRRRPPPGSDDPSSDDVAQGHRAPPGDRAATTRGGPRPRSRAFSPGTGCRFLRVDAHLRVPVPPEQTRRGDQVVEARPRTRPRRPRSRWRARLR